jgi:hypothetical protein
MSACCKPLRSNLVSWATATAASCLLFVAATVWGAEELKPTKTNIECIVGGYEQLQDYARASNLTAAQDAADAISDEVIDNINKGLDRWDGGVYAPGVLAIIFLVLAALTAVLFIKSQHPKGWRCTSKWLIFCTNILLLLAFLFFGVLLVAGISGRLSSLSTRWDDAIGDVCSDNLDTFRTQVNETKTELSNLPPSAPAAEVAEAQAELAEAEDQLGTFTTVCDCVDDTLNVLKSLLGPGILGVLAFIASMICVNSLCCTMSCCQEPACDMQDMSAAGAGHGGGGNYQLDNYAPSAEGKYLAP